MHINGIGGSYLNNRQLKAISENLRGTNSSSSVFNDVKKLDENSNSQIDVAEAGIGNLTKLGNKILNKLASFFGIEIKSESEQPAQNTSRETIEFESDDIVNKYFKPLLLDKEDETYGSDAMKSGKYDNHVTENSIKYTYDAIVAEKKSQGIDILSSKTTVYNKQTGAKLTTVEFSDGTTITIIDGTKNNTAGTELWYNFKAKDGSYAHATLTAWNHVKHNKQAGATAYDNSFKVSFGYNDGNGVSQELLRSLEVGMGEYDENLGMSEIIFAPNADEIIKENSNETTVSYNTTYFSSREHSKGYEYVRKNISSGMDMFKWTKGVGHGIMSAFSDDYYKDERHS